MSDRTGPAPDARLAAAGPASGPLGPVQAVRTVVRKTFTYSGRARRSEFWWWLLAATVVYAAAVAVDVVRDPDGEAAVVSTVVGLALLLPHLAVTVRRLHDRAFSAWWLLLHLLPFGALVVLWLCAYDSWVGPTRYGPDPKGRPLPMVAAGPARGGTGPPPRS